MKRVNGCWWQGDGLITDDGVVEREREGGHGRELAAHRCDDVVKLAGWELVGVADALDGEVQPLQGDGVEAGQWCEGRLVGAGELVELGGVFEGEVPGAHDAAGVPAWAGPPVVAEVFGVRGPAGLVLGHAVILPRRGQTSEGASGSAAADSIG